MPCFLRRLLITLWPVLDARLQEVDTRTATLASAADTLTGAANTLASAAETTLAFQSAYPASWATTFENLKDQEGSFSMVYWPVPIGGKPLVFRAWDDATLEKFHELMADEGIVIGGTPPANE